MSNGRQIKKIRLFFDAGGILRRMPYGRAKKKNPHNQKLPQSGCVRFQVFFTQTDRFFETDQFERRWSLVTRILLVEADYVGD